MGFYYKGLEVGDYRAGVELIRGSFKTAAESLVIREETFPSYGAYYTFQKMMNDVSKGIQFIGAYESTTKSLIGVIGYYQTMNNVGKLVKLSVAMNYRHKGIGKRLLYEADYRCMNLGCKRVEIGYIAENTALAQWYVGLGYKEGKTKPYKKSGLHITRASVEINHLESILERYGYSHMMLNHEEKERIEQVRIEQVKMGEVTSYISPQILLLYSREECLRASNTGCLAQQLLPERVAEYVWCRGGDELLQSYINKTYGQVDESVLIYKTDAANGVLLKDELNYAKSSSGSKSIRNKQLLILIDATWQEAKTIYKQSTYLQSLAIHTMNLEAKSYFDLRRNQVEGGLCTVEIALEVMKSQLPIELFQTYATIMKRHIRRAD